MTVLSLQSGQVGFGERLGFGVFNYFASSDIGVKADIKAIRADWVAVGNDINATMSKVRRY
jgi:hypothetical protein